MTAITVRLLLTVVLLVMVYGETGPWTVVALGFLSAANELRNITDRPKGRE